MAVSPVREAQIEREGDEIVLARLSERLGVSSRVGQAVVPAIDGVVDAQVKFDRDQTEIFVPTNALCRSTKSSSNSACHC